MDHLRGTVIRRRAALPALAFCGVVLLIGSNLVAIRLSNRELPPLWGAGTRFLAAAALFWLVLRLRCLPLPRGRSLLGAALFGVTGIAGYFALVYWGLVELEAAYGQILLALIPLITLLLSSLHGLERLHWRGLAGAALTFAGIAIIFHQQAGGAMSGASLLALVAAAVCAAQGAIFLKLFPPANLIAANTVAMTLGAVLLLGLSALSGEVPTVPARAETWAAFAFLATLGTMGTFMLAMYVLRCWSASSASYQFVLAPVVALALGGALLGETVGTDFFVGGGLVVAGVYLGAILPARPTSPPDPRSARK